MRVLDVGCGPGIYVEAMRAQGIEAWGIDPDPALVETEWVKREDVFGTLPLSFPWAYDVTLCLEVAEHLPEHLSLSLVSRLTLMLDPNGLRRILFSAAHPGQGGDGHIHCRPKDYWLGLFSYCGFTLDESATAQLLAGVCSGPHMGWLPMNAMVLRPSEGSFGARNFQRIAEEEVEQARGIARFLLQIP